MIKLLAGLMLLALSTAALAEEATGQKTTDLSTIVEKFVAQGREMATLKHDLAVNQQALKALGEKVAKITALVPVESKKSITDMEGKGLLTNF
jgi:hypothetical protein